MYHFTATILTTVTWRIHGAARLSPGAMTRKGPFLASSGLPSRVSARTISRVASRGQFLPGRRRLYSHRSPPPTGLCLLRHSHRVAQRHAEGRKESSKCHPFKRPGLLWSVAFTVVREALAICAVVTATVWPSRSTTCKLWAGSSNDRARTIRLSRRFSLSRFFVISTIRLKLHLTSERRYSCVTSDTNAEPLQSA